MSSRRSSISIDAAESVASLPDARSCSRSKHAIGLPHTHTHTCTRAHARTHAHTTHTRTHTRAHPRTRAQCILASIREEEVEGRAGSMDEGGLRIKRGEVACLRHGLRHTPHIRDLRVHRGESTSLVTGSYFDRWLLDGLSTGQKRGILPPVSPVAMAELAGSRELIERLKRSVRDPLRPLLALAVGDHCSAWTVLPFLPPFL